MPTPIQNHKLILRTPLHDIHHNNDIFCLNDLFHRMMIYLRGSLLLQSFDESPSCFGICEDEPEAVIEMPFFLQQKDKTFSLKPKPIHSPPDFSRSTTHNRNFHNPSQCNASSTSDSHSKRLDAKNNKALNPTVYLEEAGRNRFAPS